MFVKHFQKIYTFCARSRHPPQKGQLSAGPAAPWVRRATTLIKSPVRLSNRTGSNNEDPWCLCHDCIIYNYQHYSTVNLPAIVANFSEYWPEITWWCYTHVIQLYALLHVVVLQFSLDFVQVVLQFAVHEVTIFSNGRATAHWPALIGLARRNQSWKRMIPLAIYWSIWTWLIVSEI